MSCPICTDWRHVGTQCPFKPAGWRPGMRTRKISEGVYEVVNAAPEPKAGKPPADQIKAAEVEASSETPARVLGTEVALGLKALEARRRVQREYQRRKRAKERET